MNKEHFNQLVGNYSKLDDQFKDLEKLMHEFPYSQPVRMLNVKSSTSVSKKEFQQRLSIAAFYTTDRNVLRSLIESGKVPSDQATATPAKAKKVGKPVKKQIKKQASTPAQLNTENKIDAESLRKEVLANLELLQEQKSRFLKLSELPNKKQKKAKTTVAKKEEGQTKVTKQESKADNSGAIKTKSASGSPRQTKKKELIDKFIATEPRITPKKVMSENQSDLSKDSSELKEDLVSENLAVIFARQGKTSKAIEIYKKLIWKFPQKKASFAAQIEELKKKKG